MASISSLRTRKEELNRKLNKAQSNKNSTEKLIIIWQEHRSLPQFKGKSLKKLYAIFCQYLVFLKATRKLKKATSKSKPGEVRVLLSDEHNQVLKRSGETHNYLEKKLKEVYGIDPYENEGIIEVIIHCKNVTETFIKKEYGSEQGQYKATYDSPETRSKMRTELTQRFFEEENFEKAIAYYTDPTKEGEAEISIFIEAFEKFGNDCEANIEDFEKEIKELRKEISRLDNKINNATKNRITEVRETIKTRLENAQNLGITTKDILDSLAYIGGIESLDKLRELVDASKNVKELNQIISALSSLITVKKGIFNAKNAKLAREKAKKNDILNRIEQTRFNAKELNIGGYVEAYIDSIKSLFDSGDIYQASFALTEIEQKIHELSISKDTMLEKIERAIHVGDTLEKSMLEKRWHVTKKELERIRKVILEELEPQDVKEIQDELTFLREELYVMKDAVRNYENISKNIKKLTDTRRRSRIYNVIKNPPEIKEMNPLEEIKEISEFLGKLNYLILHEKLFSDETLLALLEKIKDRKYSQVERIIQELVKETGPSTRENELLERIKRLSGELKLPQDRIKKYMEYLRQLYIDMGLDLKSGKESTAILADGKAAAAPNSHCTIGALSRLKKMDMGRLLRKNYKSNAIKLNAAEADRLDTLMKLEATYNAYENGEY